MKTKSRRKATLLSILVISLAAAITLNSCQKELVKPKTKDTKGAKVAKDYSATQDLIQNEINNFLFSTSSSKKQKGMGPSLNYTDTSGGVIVTTDTVSKPHSIVYDFGSGCVGNDGKTRAGKVIINYDNQDMRIVNNVYSISLHNYSISTPTAQTSNTTGTDPISSTPVDSSNMTYGNNGGITTGSTVVAFKGIISYTNTGYNGNGNLVLEETGSFVATSNSFIDTANVNYNYEWIAGVNSSPLSNLQFSITGSTYSTFSDGSTSTLTITSALIKNCKTTGCNFCIQGTTSLVSSNLPYIKYFDYGNPGGCSGQVAVTVNGVTSIKNQ